MKINWKVRIKSLKFWLAIGPAIFLLAQAIAAPFGYKLNIEAWGVQWSTIVNAVFGVLTILGVVVDPTTPGVDDSERALAYKKGGKK